MDSMGLTPTTIQDLSDGKHINPINPMRCTSMPHFVSTIIKQKKNQALKMKVTQILGVAALCGLTVASPIPGECPRVLACPKQ